MLAALLLALALAWSATAAAISYTVQVVAVTDQDVALELQGQLLRQGFPAYVVRASTENRDVYRVRVGAFANRGAALSYAAAMPLVFGSQPVPALAETIPGGIMPLEPELLLDTATSAGFLVLPWTGGVAVRIQPDPDTPARYHVFADGVRAAFDAWSASPLDAEVLRVRNLPLWPSTWAEDTPEVREEVLRSTVSLVAGELSLSTAQVSGAVFEGEPPYLVVLERADPGTSDAGVRLALGLPGDTGAYGPQAFLGETSLVPGAAEPLYRYDGVVPDGPLHGEGWIASPDEGFTRIEPEGVGSGWRAGVGVPLWSWGSFLLTTDGARLRLFRLVPR